MTSDQAPLTDIPLSLLLFAQNASSARETDRQTDNTIPFVSLDVASQQIERILAKFGLGDSTVKLFGTKVGFVSVEHTG
jgi:hypothetical protein